MTKKPFDFSYYQSVLNANNVNTIVATLLSVGCLGGLVTGKLRQKDLGFLLVGMGIGATVIARQSSKVYQDTSFILQDYEDLSTQARTNVSFKQLQETPVVIPEYNWSNLAGFPVCIDGDVKQSEQLAEWLADKGRGNIIYVSENPSDILVSQTVVPGRNTEGTLLDILSYRCQPTYETLLDALDKELAIRRQSPEAREPLTFILDNPPRLPNIKDCLSLGLTYIVLGINQDGWTNIEVGTKAYQEAQSKNLLPYWQEVLRRWDSGEFPILVQGRLARLPFSS